MPRTFAPSKKDGTQPATETAFHDAGWSVCDVHAVGREAPDLFVAKHMLTIAIECKSPGEKRQLHQLAWADEWQGRYLCGEDALDLLTSAEELLSETETMLR